MKSYVPLLLVLGLTAGCASTINSPGPSGAATMDHQVYTLGVWRVKDGHEGEFIAAWQKLGAILASLPHPPAGKGLLVQSTTDSTLFYSFGPWDSLDDVAAMRSDSRAQEGIRALRELCSEASPGTFRVVAASQ